MGLEYKPRIARKYTLNQDQVENDEAVYKASS